MASKLVRTQIITHYAIISFANLRWGNLDFSSRYSFFIQIAMVNGLLLIVSYSVLNSPKLRKN